MSGERIAMVIDKSRAYNTMQRDKFLKRWGISEQVDKVSSFSEAGGATLFGEAPPVELCLQSADEVKEAAAYLAKKTPEEISESYPNGLVITCEVARTSTKKIEAYFKKHSLEMIIPPPQKEGNLSEKLVNDLALKSSVKKFILEYVGENYENLISLVESLSSVPRAQHGLITEEDIMIRFPQEKGNLPAWDVEQFVLVGDAKKAIETSRRVSATAFWMAILRNKIVTYYKVATMLEENPRFKDDEIVKALGLPARGFYFTKKNVQAHPVDKFEKALELVMVADGNIKGGSSAPSTALCEELLVKLCKIFKK